MKQNKLLILCALLMLAFTACSSDDDDIDNALVREVANTEPEFTYKDFEGTRGKARNAHHAASLQGNEGDVVGMGDADPFLDCTN